MNIELINENEYEETANMIERSARSSYFSLYYPKCEIDSITKSLNAEGIKQRASWTNFYVVKENKIIVGCGAIGAYWGSETESSLFSIFVDPDYQRKGIGQLIINTLENDEYFRRAKRIEIPASMAAIPFYRKMGYQFKNNELIYSEGHFALEKFNKNNK